MHASQLINLFSCRDPTKTSSILLCLSSGTPHLLNPLFIPLLRTPMKPTKYSVCPVLTDISSSCICIAQYIMEVFAFALVLFGVMIPSFRGINGDPPSPGSYPSSRVGSIAFQQGFRNLWGPQHQTLDQETLTIWLDRSSGISLVLPTILCWKMAF